MIRGSRRNRAPLAGIGLHLGLLITMEIGPFSLVMIASDLAFLDPFGSPGGHRRSQGHGNGASLDPLDRLCLVRPEFPNLGTRVSESRPFAGVAAVTSCALQGLRAQMRAR